MPYSKTTLSLPGNIAPDTPDVDSANSEHLADNSIGHSGLPDEITNSHYVFSRESALLSTAYILRMRHRFQMIGPYARMHLTQMVNFVCFGYRAKSILVIDPVSGNNFTAHESPSVTSLSARALPNPAKSYVSPIFKHIRITGFTFTVSMREPQRMALQTPYSGVRSRGNRSRVTTPAMTQSTSIRWHRNIVLSSAMAFYESLGLAFYRTITRICMGVNPARVTTATFAQFCIGRIRIGQRLLLWLVLPDGPTSRGLLFRVPRLYQQGVI